MRPDFNNGERVIWRGLPMLEEVPRRGTVVKTYRGKPSATDPGVPLMDVQFDDGELKVSCINKVGCFSPEPLSVGGLGL